MRIRSVIERSEVLLCVSMDSEDDDVIVVVKDAHGTTLANGDTVMLIKDLKVKGTSVTLKRGAKAKNIRLTDDEELIECSIEGMKGMMLRTEFLKKV